MEITKQVKSKRTKPTGSEITPRRRAVIVAYPMLNQTLSYREIKAKMGVAESPASAIFRHAVKNATVGREMMEHLLVLSNPVAEPDENKRP